MTDKTIDELTADSALDPINDSFAIWDDAAQKTKKIAAGNLVANKYVVGLNTGCSTFKDAITTLSTAGTDCTLVIPPSVNEIIASSLVSYPNINLEMMNGSKITVPTGLSLTIQGPINAGPWQWLDWAGTGAIDMKSSPTHTIYAEWWGGVADPLDGSHTHDNSGILEKMVESTERHQEWQMLAGCYRITSAWVIDRDSGISIRGCGLDRSAISIDIGGTGTGVSFGTLTKAFLDVKLRDMAFIGTSSVSCDIGVAFILCRPDVERVAMCVGTTDCICQVAGVIASPKLSLFIGRQLGFPAIEGTSGSPFKMVPIDAGPYSGYTSNVNVLDLLVTTCGTTANSSVWSNPIEIGSPTSANSGGQVGSITGTLEAFDKSPINFYRVRVFDLSDFYIEGTLAGPGLGIDDAILFDRCTSTTIRNMYINTVMWVKFYGCNDMTITDSNLWYLWLRQDNRGMVINNLILASDNDVLRDDTPDTQYLGRNCINSSSGGALPSSAPVMTNFLRNSSFANWDTDKPLGYTFGSCTLTQCGDGMSDTTTHWATNTVKMVTPGTGVAGGLYALISPATLRSLKGKLCTGTWWVYAPAGQTAATAGAAFSNLDAYIPARANGTGYKIGDAVLDVPGNCYFCVVAGTSGGSAPTWNTTYLKETADGTVTWVRMDADICLTSSGSSYVNGYAGTWQKIVFSFVVPYNATDLSPRIILSDKADDSAATYYIAEPSLVIGSISPAGYLPSLMHTTGSLTLDNGGGTTTTVDAGDATTFSKIFLTATSANAAVAGIYISTKNDGSFVVTHPASPGASATMDYQVVN